MKKMMLNCFLALSLAVTSTAFAKDTHLGASSNCTRFRLLGCSRKLEGR